MAIRLQESRAIDRYAPFLKSTDRCRFRKVRVTGCIDCLGLSVSVILTG